VNSIDSIDTLSSNESKYYSRNFFSRLLISRFISKIVARISNINPSVILDVGCGEGFIARCIIDAMPGRNIFYTGIDINTTAVKKATDNVREACFHSCNFLEANFPEGRADVVICLEVLEHMSQPEKLLNRLKYWASSGTLLLSVPWEPWFRIGSFLRGKYLSTWGNHPEHIQHYNPHSIELSLKSHFRTVFVTTSFPWILTESRDII
jgi:2-polyprenyl-3-methyl-5-hydroxy-6-metoxy-1,4-benzoquinol methylase